MLICFDLDNTINDRQAAVDTWIGEFLARPDVAALGSIESERAWLVALDQDGYRSRADAFGEIRERYQLDATVDDLVAAYRSRVVELARLVPGAVACLNSFRQAGWTIAIVTNGSSGQQHSKIDRLGVRGLVDVVVVSEDLGIKKPDPLIFQAASDAAGIPLNGAWMVGDAMLQDIVGGARCGMKTAWIRRGRSWDRSLDGAPTLAVDDLRVLYDLVESDRRQSTKEPVA